MTRFDVIMKLIEAIESYETQSSPDRGDDIVTVMEKLSNACRMALTYLEKLEEEQQREKS